MSSKKKEKIKVGFDLDGVLLYNPARIFRPITVEIKKIIKKNKRKKTHFYYPKSKIEKTVWRVVHWSSMFLAPGLDDIKNLVETDQIEAYIVTSRYDCLQGDFQKWLDKMDAEKYFKSTFHNKKNIQPHLFKEEKINELKLDYFVEDNWDIVRHINKKTQAKCLWISNAIDSKIPYKLKFLTLKEAVKEIEKIAKTKER